MNDHSILLLLHHAVGPIYIMLTAAALLSIISPALNELSSHGKTRFGSIGKCHGKNNYDSDTNRSRYQRLWDFLLHSKYLFANKGRFIDFYAVGSIITTITILLNFNWSGIHTTTKSKNDHRRLLPAYILLIHLVRRFCECLWVQKSVSTSTMHFAGYLLGVIHYLFLPFVFIPDQEQEQDSGSNVVKSFMVFMGCLFFQYQQHRHHVILGNLRPNTSTGGINSYQIPKGGWFEFVSCPHYLAEIMVYFMLAILIQLQTDTATMQDEENGMLSRIHAQKHWIVLVWVSTNLSISAERTHVWYILTFGKAYPERQKLIPFVW